MMKEGLVSFFASDGHGTSARKPILSGAYAIVAEQLGDEQAQQMFVRRPQSILANEGPEHLAGPRPAVRDTSGVGGGRTRRFIHRMFGSE
jgi:protein-tyrosine phosphatase